MAAGTREGVGDGKNCFNRPVVRLKQLGLGGGGGEASWEHQKKSRYSKQNNNFALASHFVVHFFSTLCRHCTDYYVKLPNLFTFEGKRKKTTTNFPFYFSSELGIRQ